MYSAFQQTELLHRHAILHIPSQVETGGVVRAFDSHGAKYSIQLPPLKGLSFVAVRLPPEAPHPTANYAKELVDATIASLVSAGLLEALAMPQCDFPACSPLTMNVRSTCMMLNRLCDDGAASSNHTLIEHYTSLLKTLLVLARDLNGEQDSYTRANWQPGSTDSTSHQ